MFKSDSPILNLLRMKNGLDDGGHFLERNRSLEDHIADVIQQLRENRSGFLEISSDHGGIMQLVAYFKSGYPGLDFERELVKSLAEFSLSVDFDFYYMYSDSREDS